MATETQEENQTVEATEETPAKKRFNLGSKKVKVLVLLVVVMGVQLAGLYLFLPSTTSVAPGGEDPGGDGDDVETVEVTIDNFVVYNGVAAPGRRLSINFKLTVAVSVDQEIAFDQAANKDQKAQIRAAVGEVVGDSGLEELNDPRHNVILRKLKERINKELGKSYVQRVFVSGFQVIEQ